MLDNIFELQEQSYTDNDAQWDEFVKNHPQGSLLQTTNWARLKGRFNWTSRRVWLKQDGRFVAGAQILFRSAALGLLKIGYIPHGPLVNWEDEEQVKVLFNQIDWAAYQHRAGMIKLEPMVWQDELPSGLWAQLCQTYDLQTETDTIQPPQTLLVDLRSPLDEILAAMKQKTRYNIRLADRQGVVVRQGTAADIPIFNSLMLVTGQRDGFSTHDPVYYKTAFELFAPLGQMGLFIAEFENRPLAAVMVSINGDKATYLYGASSNDERQRMPTYAVQWAAMQWAKAQGSVTYDLWGIPDQPEADLEAKFTQRQDGLWSVYRFKRGFGGRVRRTVGTGDRIYNRHVYKLYRWRKNR